MADRIRARVGERRRLRPGAPSCSTPAIPTPRPGRARPSSWVASSTTGPRSSCATGTRSRTATPRRPSWRSARLQPARVSGGVGQAPGLAVNRRERTADGRTILGWNPDGVRDDAVVAIRVDGLEDAPADPIAIATLVSFACHPVVIGPDVPGAGAGLRRGRSATRSWSELRRAAVTVFLQGAAGDALPLEAFRDDERPCSRPIVFGGRVALEAAPRDRRRRPVGGRDRPDRLGIRHAHLAVSAPARPTSSRRSRCATARRIVSLPLLELPSVAELRARARGAPGGPRGARRRAARHASR